VFGLPFNFQTIIFQRPDRTWAGLKKQALLDTSWSGATAPNAAISLWSRLPPTLRGADLSRLYIIDNDIGDGAEDFGVVSCGHQYASCGHRGRWHGGRSPGESPWSLRGTRAPRAVTIWASRWQGPVSVNVSLCTPLRWRLATPGTAKRTQLHLQFDE
jgi:hypothetical protein